MDAPTCAILRIAVRFFWSLDRGCPANCAEITPGIVLRTLPATTVREKSKDIVGAHGLRNGLALGNGGA